MTDIFERIEKHTGGPLGQYAEKAFGYYMFPKLEGELGPHMKFQGKDVLVWSLNNYLGLANHPEVRKADAEAAAKWGLAYPMGSRMMTGHTDLHERFERELADFERKEDAFRTSHEPPCSGPQCRSRIPDQEQLVYRHRLLLSLGCLIKKQMVR